MPIKDGSTASQFHSETIIEVTGRIRQRIATSGLRGAELEAISAPWEFMPRIRLNYHRAGLDLGGFTSGQALSLISALNLQPSDNVLIVGAGFGWASEKLRAFVPGMGVTNLDTSGWIHSVKEQDEQGDIEVALDAATHWTTTDAVMLTAAQKDLFRPWLNMGNRRPASELIAEEDGLTNRSRQAIKKLTTADFTHIITANVLPWLWDAEVANMSDAARQLQATARIVHYVTPYSDTARTKGDEPAPMLNWKRVGDATLVDTVLTDQPNYIESDWKAVLPNDEFILAGANKVFA